MRTILTVALARVPAFLGADPQTTPAKPEHSAEDVVIEQLVTELAFSEDGTGRREHTARVRIQSEAGVKQFGVLTFPYRSDIERVESIHIQVRKPDGRTVITPESNVQDLPAAVTREAPTYSDQREKQAPVRALRIGDILEWRVLIVRSKADVAGQFWYAHNFNKDQIVLEEVLRIAGPAGKYVKVSSPSVKPEVREEDGRKVYAWKTSRKERPKEDAVVKPSVSGLRSDVQLTTFRNWEEVGQWYGALEKSRIEVTPAIRAKAAELIAGLNSNSEKQRAIYRFVATKFRYISLSFGEGRYQPHAADEVLANQYGDCKDKHTLFAALLRAAGIEAWPALIGAGLNFDPEMPSPAQFNHVITYVPQAQSPVWLDTTPEVAPYGLLQQPLRDKQALVIPVSGAPSLMLTAKEPPFASDETVIVESKLSSEGTLTGRFEITSRGDSEVILRSVFHAAAPAQWSTLAQNISNALGYAGTIRDLEVDSPVDLEAPFHYSYNYERKKYADWENRRIMPPIPFISPIPTEAKKSPKEPVYIGAPGKFAYRAKVELPSGYSVEIPGNAKLQTGFASKSKSRRH